MQAVQSPFITTKLPQDKQGFTQAFDVDNFDPQEVLQFYQKFGLVIFNDVLNENQVKKSIDDLWNDMEQFTDGKIKRNVPKTWDNFNVYGRFGFVNSQPIIQPQLCKNRSHPKIYKAFKRLYQLTSNQKIEEPLFTHFDRGSILKPFKENDKYTPIHHFDIHPWWWTDTVACPEGKWRRYNRYDQSFAYWLGEGNYIPKVKNYTKLQGVLGLSNTNAESGGFQVVCGFQNYIKEWCNKTKENTGIAKCPQLINNMQKVYQRAGSIIVFSRQLPHNIYQNISQNFRYAQYLRMAPQSSMMLTPKEKEMRKKQVKILIHKDMDMNDPIFRELYMLDQNILANKQEGSLKKCQIA